MAIAEVIKFEGPQDALVWKFPIEDFNATSQLIVDETHEALLVVNGNAADLFTAGRRTLSVPNIPIARTLIEIPTGGNSPFPCKVFFINKVHAMDLLWGTQGPIALEDPLGRIRPRRAPTPCRPRRARRQNLRYPVQELRGGGGQRRRAGGLRGRGILRLRRSGGRLPDDVHDLRAGAGRIDRRGAVGRRTALAHDARQRAKAASRPEAGRRAIIRLDKSRFF